MPQFPVLSLLENSGDGPLYQRLYAALVEQIRTGGIPADSRLPGKRTLAAELGLSVNTVDTAYQMLAAEGYVESRPRSGFWVSRLGRQTPPVQKILPAAEPPAAPAPTWTFDLRTGNVDTRQFPFRTWGRIQKELLYSSPQLLNHGSPQGDENLRAALCRYLAAYRGVQCTPAQIVVGAGLEYLLGLLAPLLGGTCAVEDPGYGPTRHVLENSGLPCRSVAVDKYGLSAQALQESGANLCYITPSHQFPTGVTMSAPRRAALLDWAAQTPERYILEDDFDAEFRFDQRPLPSLQGMAGAEGPVVYLSTVSRDLAPSIRMAYMVLPRGLLSRWKARYGGYANTVSRFEQQTFCRFLEDGCFTRHLARTRNTGKHRRDALTDALTRTFGREKIHLSGLHTGLHLLLTLPDGPAEADMVQLAAKAGIRLTGLSAYYHTHPGRCPAHTVVLGYSTLDVSQADALASLLKKAWSQPTVSSENS